MTNSWPAQWKLWSKDCSLEGGISRPQYQQHAQSFVGHGQEVVLGSKPKVDSKDSNNGTCQLTELLAAKWQDLS